MGKKAKHAISPLRQEDYPAWYQQVVRAADMAENSDVRGCMVIKPWGYGIWENMQGQLDAMFKATGHVNAYFPLFIPLSYMEKEAEHVEGFAKECAVVTHHRLEDNGEGGLRPAGELDEPLVVRPTSEMIIGATYARWVKSWRDLPVLVNQWANVVRWEMRTRLFLRTAEFLWQEGHTAHATEEEAVEETMQMLQVYKDFAENWMAMPVIPGEKTADERFPGALNTWSIEAMMQDRKALQAGTSHFLGQNFSKAMNIAFQDKDGQEKLAWTTSWGVSTRLIGGLIMTHADDDGMVVPPALAPVQVVILPIYRSDDQRAGVLEFCANLEKRLKDLRWRDAPVRVLIDDRDIRGGEKAWQHIKKGVPLRAEVGPRDVESGSVFLGRRDDPGGKKAGIAVDEFVAGLPAMLDGMQDGLLEKARRFRDENSMEINDLRTFEEYFTPQNREKPEIHGGFAACHFVDGDPQVQEILKKHKVTVRCIPVDGNEEPGECLFTGKPSARRGIFAKAY